MGVISTVVDDEEVLEGGCEGLLEVFGGFVEL